MKKETKTIRLIYPQWQGANIVKLITAYSGGYPFSISGDIRSVPS